MLYANILERGREGGREREIEGWRDGSKEGEIERGREGGNEELRLLTFWREGEREERR